MSDPGKAVFLSYASQDAEAAKRICEALRVAGLEVWFDQSELRGGDAWDQKIRKQIKECALFVPIISAATQARAEGYFRLEWKLAVDRSHLMADDQPFLFPIVIGDVSDATARVPDKFREVQWTRLRLDETPAELAARVSRLLSGQDVGASSRDGGNARGRAQGPPQQQKESGFEKWWWLIFPIMGMAMPIIGLLKGRPERERPEARPVSAPVPPPAATLSPGTGPVAGRDWPQDPELKRAHAIIAGMDASVETMGLAEDIVKAVLARRPADPEATVIYAMLNTYLINRGYDYSEERYVLARRYCERALQLAPDEPEAMAAMAQFLTFRNTDYARAGALIRRAIELAPQEPRFARILVYSILLDTDLPAALAQAKADCDRFPRDALTQYDLALVARRVGDLTLMEQALDRTLALSPLGSAMVWKGWLAAWVHEDLPQFKVWLERLTGNFRLGERAVFMRYVYACLSGDAVYGLESVRAFPGTWMNDFYYVGPRSLLIADLLALQGKADLAATEYEKALAEIRQMAARNPNDRDVVRAEVWALLGLKRPDEARAVAKRDFGLLPRPYRPSYMVWWNHSLRAQLVAGERADALALIREAVTVPAVRKQLQVALRIDPAMAPFRDDAEIQALLAEPAGQ